MSEIELAAVTLVELLRLRKRQEPGETAYVFLSDNGEEERLTYAELDRKARALAALLQSRNAQGERALLLYQPGIDYLIAFFGCLYAGVFAVPAYPPRQNGNLSRLQAVVADSRASFALATGKIAESVARRAAAEPELARLDWIVTDGLSEALADTWQEPQVTADTLAFLQYTSGSTALPKGVMLTHGNLMHNLKLIETSFGTSRRSSGVVWLPPYHDMGLIGGILQPLFTGYPMTLMAPVSFITKPLRWLEAISRTGATVSGGPNFAYELCVQKITPEQRDTLDLSSWENAFTGAEPIRQETLDRFAEFFAPSGFRREAFYPCYGLAEGTLFVTGGMKQEAPIAQAFSASALKDHLVETAADEESAQVLVSSGRPALGNQEVLVVDPERRVPCADGHVGEIWVHGPSVAQGYWEREEQTRETFGAVLADTGRGPFLRTGDLGFLHEGELYITGRRKDLIIIRGRNFYPQDIEFTVQASHPAIHNSNGAAFAVEVDGEERLVVVQEIERAHRKADLSAVIAAVREQVSQEHELQVYAVVLLKPASIPKTSSGKIQRHKCKERFLEGSLEVVADSLAARAHAEAVRETEPAEVTLEMLTALDAAGRQQRLEQDLLAKLAQVLHMHPSALSAEQPLTQWGLDSLMAVEVKNAVEEQLGLEVPFALLLEGVSVVELATELCRQVDEVCAKAAKMPDGKSAELCDGVADELSYGQQSLWFLQKLALESTAYHVARAVKLQADLDVPRLQRAFERLTERHEALRSVYVEADGAPQLKVQETAGDFFAVEHAHGWTDEQMQARLSEAAKHPIDLEKGPLLQVRLFRREQESILLFHVHHIAVDFWTFGVLLQEIGRLYAGAELPPVKAGYREYVQWQKALLCSPKGEALQAYWEQAGADLPLLQLSADRPRKKVQSDRGGRVRFALSAEMSDGLQALAREQGVTLYAALLAAYQVLLHRVTGEDDIVVGSPTVGRSSAKFSETVGYFVNPVPLRTHVTGELPFAALLPAVKETVVSALLHQDYPFALMAERLQPDRDPSVHPLFQTLFTLQKSHLAQGEALGGFALGEAGAVFATGGLQVESMPFVQESVQLDLALTMAWQDGRLTGVFDYRADLFDPLRIERLTEHFVTLLSGIVADAQAKIADLPLLTAKQGEQVLAWKRQTVAFETDVLLHELFERQAARTPDAVAVVSEESHVTYSEMDTRANKLAHALAVRGVGPGQVVALCAERSVELVVGMLAVLKTGGAYVPVDPGYPAERIAYMIGDANPAVLLTQKHLRDALPVDGADVICLDDIHEAVDAWEANFVAANVTGDDPAYLIYTSGSTGQPKGVVIPHRAIVNHMLWMQQEFPLTADDVVLQKTAFSFDASVWEFYAPLFAGATLVLARPGGQADPAYLVQAVQTYGVTTLQVVPSMLQLLLEEPNVEECVTLKRLFCGGEALTKGLVQQFHARLSGQLVNLYGPTEAAIDTTFWVCEPDDGPGDVPIGKPIANAEVYVLDAALHLVPVGVPGELYIGGAGLALGYFKQLEQTAQKFIPNPFGAGRLYRTGDSVRWREDGALEFLGRLDDQVKLRGFRIELGEIEAVLRRHDGVQEAVVVVRDQRLAAYLTGAGDIGLHAYLKGNLPDYMVPSALVWLEHLPLTANGKVDRKALPAPEWTGAGEAAFVVPRTETEAGVAAIWQEVLGVEQVGAEDNFFALGGHSLLAAKIVSRINRRFDVDLPLRTLFAAPTVAELAAEVHTLAGSGMTPLVPILREGALPLSFAQERLWFIDRLEGASALYNIPGAVRLSGALDVSALERSLQEIVARHEALRTIFTVVDGQAVQQIKDGADFTLAVADSAEEDVQSHASTEATVPFDLEKGPLLRAKLLRLADDEHVLILAMHHIVSDGWSLGVLLRELSALYAACLQQEPSPLQPLAVQYADYAVWQQQNVQGAELDKQLAYWKHKLSGELPVLQLPTDRPRPSVQTANGDVLSFALPATLTAQLRELAAGADGTTLFTLLLTAYKTLLYRYTGTEDLRVGTPVAGRTQVELEPLIGFFVNTLVLRDKVDGSMTFRQLLEQVKTTALEALAAQDVPFEKLVEELQPERSLSHSPLFQAMFTWQPSPLAELNLPGVSHRQVEMHSRTAKFDLTLMMEDRDGLLTGMIEYRTDLFDKETIARIAGHFQTLLQAAVLDPDLPLAQLPMLTAEEQAQLALWNDTERLDALKIGVHQWFEKQADATPQQVALLFGESSLTYRELNERANSLARRLQKLGAGPGQMVGLCMERSLELIIGMLAILKAGAAYVPFDADYPADRLRFQLEDAKVSLLLTQERMLAKLSEHGAQTLCVDGFCTEEGAEEGTENLGIAADPDDLAYVMYTSGSTGQPKGVMVPHRGVVRLVKDTDYVQFSEHDVFLQFAPVAFDAATFEIWGALLNGAQLVIFPPGQASLGELGRVIQGYGVTTLWLTAGLFHQMAEHHLDGLRGVRQLLAGGDVLSVPHVQTVVERLDCRFINGYGPTECTTFAVCHEVQKQDLSLPSLPIGRVIANTTALIFDQDGQAVPVGVPGELHIGGAGVALGYLNRPELTAERFVNTAEHGRLYKTGDMVRRLADGTMEFLGRTDHQVKVRGYRIELGEIEAAIAKHPSVHEAVVLVREDSPGDQRIVAYVTMEATADGTGELRRHLKDKLPSYMVPQHIVAVEAFLLTANGKIDRRALPAPLMTEGEREYTAPRTALEERLCSLFEEVLHTSPIGIHDDFFAAGGHSLLATQAVTRIQAAFGIDLPLRKLFEAPTAAELAVVINETALGANEAASIVPTARAGHVPMSFAQERMWLLNQLLADSSAYHISGAVRMRGPLDRSALTRSLHTIVERHEALRTSFNVVNGQAVQLVRRELAVEIPLTDLTSLPEDEREEAALQLALEQARQPFDLTGDALVRLSLICLGDDDHLLVMVMHHIISDGWSLGVLLQELSVLYGGRELPELAVQYADYAQWQRNWLQGETLEQQLEYWKRKLGGSLPLLQLPADRPRPAVQTTKGAQLAFAIPKELTARLKELGQTGGETLYMTLLAAFKVLMFRYTGQDDIAVGSPVAGRNRVEIERLIGFFVNTLVLRSDLSGEPAFRDLLAQVKQTALEAYAHQDVPFEKLVSVLQPERNSSHTPLFQVLFALQNAPMQIELPGLAIERLNLDNQTAKFDLSLLLEEADEELSGMFEYNTDLFEEATIKRLAGHFRTLLQGIVADPGQKITELPLLTRAEAEQLSGVKGGAREFAPLCLHELFERQAARTPDAPAILSAAGVLSYSELNARANRLAHYLQGQGGGPDGLIAICMERSPELLIAILAVLKAGAAYVPIDPAYPQDRISFLLADGGAPLLLTESHVLAELPAHTATAVCLDRDGELFAGLGTDNPRTAAQPHHLAYIIYTSGSTGKPKGVAIEHRNASSFIQWAHEVFSPEELQGVLFSTSVCFDLSIFELFAPLSCGGQVILAQNALQLPMLAAKEQVTMINTVPSAIAELLRLQAIPASVKVVNLAGEPLKLDIVERLYEIGTLEKVYNLYGPSEDTTYSTYELMQRGSQAKPLIGMPIAGTQAYLLDANLQPVPVGVPGELFLGGAGVARGYLGRPELTAEKFMRDPFSGRPDGRMYRTGDLVRALPDGRLDYLGRLDHQIKLRGFRIELGEIEAALLKHHAVRETVVMVREDRADEKRLAAYLVLEAGVELTTAELREHAGRTLPSYMIPSAFILLEAMPLTSNGKIDRKALPVPEGASVGSSAAYAAPQSEQEERLAAIWRDVLKRERIGIDDNYFEAGGDSILAIQVLTRAREAGLTFTMPQLFQHQTIRELAQEILLADAVPGGEVIPQPYGLLTAADRAKLPQGVEDAYPLTMLQGGMLFHSLYGAEQAAYHNVTSLRLRLPFAEAKMRQALERLLQRHAVLRTSFVMTGYSEPLQLVQSQVELSFAIRDLRGLTAPEQEQHVQEWLDAESRAYFDVTHAPLMRFHVDRLRDDEMQFTITYHHGILDGWSLATLTTELFGMYLDKGVKDAPRGLFRRFVDLERQALASEEAQGFWLHLLDEFTVTEVPAVEAPDDSQELYRSVEVEIGEALQQGLQRAARQAAVPLKSTLLVGFLRTLSLYSGQTDVLTGVVVNGRPEVQDGERALGLFLNTVPYRLQLQEGSWLHLLQETFAAERSILPHRRFPMATLQQKLGGQPLFDSAFNFVNFHVLSDLAGELEVLSMQESGHTNYPLVAEAGLDPETGRMTLALRYNTKAYGQGQVERMAHSFRAALQQMALAPESAHATAVLLEEDQLKQLAVWNRTGSLEDAECLHRLVEAQAQHTPDACALVTEAERLTYRELNERANRLAHRLQKLGAGPDVRVAVCLERNASLVIALLAVLKAGAAYLPLDPAYPEERIEFLLQDAGAALVITDSALGVKCPATAAAQLCLDLEQELLADEPWDNPRSTVTPSHLAYVIYTSGSTGLPKGVGVEHRSVSAMLQATFALYAKEDFAACLFSTSVCFDPSVLELFAPLSLGGTVILAENALHLPHLQAKDEVTMFTAVPSAVTELLRQQSIPASVRTVNMGGEMVKGPLVQELYQLGHIEKVYNMYGPTESTVYSTLELCERGGSHSPPIGKPIPGTRAFVLDEFLQPAPIGVPGELFLSGAGLARGYLGRPELTAERFLPHPLAQGERIYRTGDRVRRLPDGRLEYLGRLDHQVKVRGYRIETGEIEAALMQHPAVLEAAVLVREDAPGGKQIVGYVVLQTGEFLTMSDLRAAIKVRLPDYMVPSLLVTLDALPLTPNGKVDKKALPAPDLAQIRETPYVAPRTDLESRLCAIWEQLLGVEQVGVHDNFFDLGGHSLLATQLVSRVREVFAVELALRDLFAARTVEQFAAVVEAAGQTANETMTIAKSANRKTRTRSR
ncbi:hypothetical protein CBW65_20310 [Tumebacillus avium]|uniref:Carrier domain-containing protein n=1 Tax=Tumebacillus avium TaxID=1903704 RepID=A0A1Y0ITD4_9BACL|nr:non-ribosomal peptide synthetase [Tumebacillus avium]ARU63056.1 hypothetical protein CBW65_20310 [Tumebacillus avium]